MNMPHFLEYSLIYAIIRLTMASDYDGQMYSYMHTLHAVPIDYNTAAINFTFDASNSRHCASVTIMNDDILETTESFSASLTSADSAVTLVPNTTQIEILADPNDGKKTHNSILITSH